MAKLGQTFNPTEHDTEQRGEFENLPDGIYRLEVSSSTSKEEHDDNGNLKKYVLKVTYDVIEPEEYKGRKVFGNFNLVNPTARAMEIGNSQFASLCRAVGINDPVDESEDLHFISFVAKVGMGKDSKEKNADGSPQWPAKNEVKTFYFPTDNDGNPVELPVPQITGPVRPANDNRRAANDNRTTAKPAAAGGEKKSRPWGKS